MEDSRPIIIGLGASAGGLEPILEVLGQLPVDPAVAIIVVQHLDPVQPSLLADIVARAVSWPVQTAVDGLTVEPGTVYVIAPNTRITVHEGQLQVSPRASSPAPPMPVDDLLESLAQDRGSDAIGIVLSGSGSDGALGLLAIKAHGGFTFAQDETSARFAGMPRAAAQMGGVDRVLPTREIADEVSRIVRQRRSAQPTEPPEGTADDTVDAVPWPRLFLHLQRSCGVDFSHYKRGTLARRLARRIALQGHDGPGDYLAALETDPVESQALCRDLLIRFTEFFRDASAFQALVDTALPHLLKDADPGRPLRIWVPGCASGEEVYSIAICVTEFLQQRALPVTLQIFGTDVSDDALQLARQGRYLESIARAVSPERLARFFVKEGETYRVIKSLRDTCTFARHNVAQDPPFSRIDLLSCRNVLIYMDPVLQKRVMPAFHFALRPQGILVLGLSETVGAHTELFVAMDSAHGRMFVRQTTAVRAGTPAPLLLAQPAPRGRVAPREMPGIDEGRAVQREADRVALQRYAPPGVLCDEDFNVLEFRGDTSPFLGQPGGPPTRHLMRLARPPVVAALSEAARRARSAEGTVRADGITVTVDGAPREGHVEVVPVASPRLEGRWFLVTFLLDPPDPTGRRGPALWHALRQAVLNPLSAWAWQPGQGQIGRLQSELQRARDQALAMVAEQQSTIEALTVLEEEAQAASEEYQSTNEELETAKEELQSLNEELSTTNDELRFRNGELKKVHEQASHARDYAEAVIDTMSQPLLVLDRALRVVRANEAYYRCFRTTPAETLQVGLFALGTGQWDVPALRRLVGELLPHNAQIRQYAFSASFPGLGLRSIMLNASRLLWDDAVMVLLTIDDVTERQATLDELSQADRQKDEFLVVLAHELRNPLAGMSNAVRLLRHPLADEAVRARAWAMLDRQLANQCRMVDELLDISRITQGLVALRRQPMDLAQTVRLAAESLQTAVEQQEHRLRLDLSSRPLWVDGDAVRLEQVVVNLLSNAIKYTPPRGQIDVRLHRDGTDAVLEVRDNGIGMTPQLVREAFGIFVRAPVAEHVDIAGLGVGLSVVRRIVDMHGGSVKTSSAGPGQGSQFTVRLPALPDTTPTPLGAPEPAGPVQADPAPATGGARVLVVDDNVDAGQGIAALLELDGFTLRTAVDGPSALREAEAFGPDAVLLDLGLPGMDGYELCQRLRQRFPALQIVVISGFGRVEEVKKARDCGADHHFTKPADPREVADLLRRGRPHGPSRGGAVVA